MSHVTDLAPEVKLEDKATIIIKRANGDLDGFIMTMDMVDQEIAKIPAGDTLDNLLPPQSMLGQHPSSLDDTTVVTIPEGSSTAQTIEFPPTPTSR